MSKSTKLRVLGFIGAIGASAVLVGAATNGTGAYFTESHSGAINASTGGVHVATTNLSLDFAQLLPGEFQSRQIGYTSTGSGLQDIWLVLPTDGTADSLNGIPGTPSGTAALGRYGHFAVTGPDGSFTSYNLATAGTGTHSGPTCSTDSYGRGGSEAQAATRTDYSTPFCPVPNAILLSYGIASGASANATITFGFTKLIHAAGQEDSPLAPLAQFKIVATQHGINPSDPNN